jgi:hypothetical protein
MTGKTRHQEERVTKTPKCSINKGGCQRQGVLTTRGEDNKKVRQYRPIKQEGLRYLPRCFVGQVHCLTWMVGIEDDVEWPVTRTTSFP